jgi:hypothetical protein
MIYRVVTYDRSTERMKGAMPVPPFVLDKINKIAGFKPQDDGLGEYLLDEDQTRQVAQILAFGQRQTGSITTSSLMNLPKMTVCSRA